MNPEVSTNANEPNSRERPLIAADGELLLLYHRHSEQAAFEQIVRRHHQLVLNVCRNVLRCNQDAEDASQATFLILARRAASLQHVESVAGWLYKVALRTAMTARRRKVRRKEETNVIEVAHEQEAFRAIEKQELVLSLYEELAKMPEQLRTPLVLFHLDGKTRTQVAEQLDTTVEAIKSRLARGRPTLRARLTQRGIGLSMAIVAACALNHKKAQAALVDHTVRLCVSEPLNIPASGIHDSITSLAYEGAKDMTSTITAKTVAFAMVLLLLVGGLSVTAPGQSSSTKPKNSIVTLSNTEPPQADAPVVSPHFVVATATGQQKGSSSMVSKAARERAVEALIKALRDESDKVRGQAAYTLGEIGVDSTNAIDALFDACLNPISGKLTEGNLRAIGKIINESDYAYGVLVGLVSSNEHRHVGLEIASYSRRKSDELLNAAIKVLENDDDNDARDLAASLIHQFTKPQKRLK